jgi:protein-tyrosine phosphatase
MIDLHCHILSGLDDGASDLKVSLDMARMFVEDGVEVVACTPHILPGLYHSEASEIRAAVDRLHSALIQRDIKLDLVCGSDAHMTPDFVAKLKSGRILSLADSRYVLVEPPHHVAPARLEQFFFEILVAGYVPILTHPERLTWINSRYATIERLARAGVWMQITAGSLIGNFGSNARYWAERMLDEGCVHIIASDAHDTNRRPPDLARGAEAAAKRAGDVEARHLVLTRPRGVLQNAIPSNLPSPFKLGSIEHPKSA